MRSPGECRASAAVMLSSAISFLASLCRSEDEAARYAGREGGKCRRSGVERNDLHTAPSPMQTQEADCRDAGNAGQGLDANPP
jgi:hypothetical protein